MPLSTRSCDICGSNKIEPLWQYGHRTRTRSHTYNWESCIVVCSVCGFCFASPAPSHDDLEKFYADSFTSYAKQEVAYSVTNRSDLLAKHCTGGTYVEIGSSNNNKELVVELNKKYSEIILVEPNDSALSKYCDIASVPSNIADTIAAYSVLEHVANLNEFLSHCKRILRPGGKILLEVPNIGYYPIFPLALFLGEHITHFSPQTLTILMEQNGFSLIDVSFKNAGNPLCFVGVFTHEDGKKSQAIGRGKDEVLYSKACVEGGVGAIQDYLDNMKKCRAALEKAAQANENSVVWAANRNSLLLLNKWSLPSGAVVVDSDERKKNLFADVSVTIPDDTFDHIISAKCFVICTSRHADNIKIWLGKYIDDLPNREIHILDFGGQHVAS